MRIYDAKLKHRNKVKNTKDSYTEICNATDSDVKYEHFYLLSFLFIFFIFFICI